MNKKMTNDNESLPVTSARLMAFLTVAMSLGFVLVVFLFFFQDLFQGAALLGVLLVMLTLSFFSVTIALKRMMAKILCSDCAQPFFARVLDLFVAPDTCQSCKKPLKIEK